MTRPWKIVHVELSQVIPSLPAEPDCQGVYAVFWWHGIPLGHREILAAQLPMPAIQLANLAAQAVTPAVGDALLPYGFQVPLSEHFAHRPQVAFPDFHLLSAVERPLAQFGVRRSYADRECGAETVSIVVCTRDRPEQLARCIQSLQGLSYSPHEVIVVDNAPTTDETRQLVSAMPGVCYLREPRPGLSAARNAGIRRSTGSIVAFTDDDVMVHPGWIARLLPSFQNPRVMATTGLVLPAELETESQIVFEVDLGGLGGGYRAKTFGPQFIQSTQHLGTPVWRIGAGANMAFRRQVFELVGGFDERLGAGASGCSEDSEFWYRVLAAGWLCRYEPAAVVFHCHRREFDDLKRQTYQYMRGHVTALLVQFARHRHVGNLRRLFWTLPTYYAGLLIKALGGFEPRYKTWLAEIVGCLAGIVFYLRNRNSS